MQIDIDGTLIGMRYPTEVNLVGDARRHAAGAAAAAVRARPDRAWREKIEENVAALVGRPWSGRPWSTRTR